jgi:hypothetical protein
MSLGNWTYSMTPIVPGLTIIADPVDDRLAQIVGVPTGAYSGPVTIAATDGTVVVSRVVTVTIGTPITTAIASLEFSFEWLPAIQFAFNLVDVDSLRLSLLFEFKEMVPIVSNFTPTIVFTFEPIVPVVPPILVFEPEIEFTFTPTLPINNGS